MQSVPTGITTNVLSSNPDNDEVYSIPHCVINLSLTCDRFGFLTQVSSTNETDRHDITEILLKVALSTITLTLLRAMILLTNRSLD